jgi:hypothetical protein
MRMLSLPSSVASFKSLKQPAPFGYFVTKMRGRIVAESLQSGI